MVIMCKGKNKNLDNNSKKKKIEVIRTNGNFGTKGNIISNLWAKQKNGNVRGKNKKDRMQINKMIQSEQYRVNAQKKQKPLSLRYF